MFTNNTDVGSVRGSPNGTIGAIGNQRSLNVFSAAYGAIGANGTIEVNVGTIGKTNDGSVQGSPNGIIGKVTNDTIGSHWYGW